MTITTYTDREIALTKRIAELEKELSDTDALLEECKMDWSGNVIQIKAEHKHEVETLRQQLAEAQALIEANRQQEAVAWRHLYKGNEVVYYPYINRGSFYTEITPLYTAPVVAPDVLKDAQRYRWLRDEAFNGFIVENMSVYPRIGLDAAIDEAMGGAV